MLRQAWGTNRKWKEIKTQICHIYLQIRLLTAFIVLITMSQYIY